MKYREYDAKKREENDLFIRIPEERAHELRDKVTGLRRENNLRFHDHECEYSVDKEYYKQTNEIF